MSNSSYYSINEKFNSDYNYNSIIIEIRDSSEISEIIDEIIHFYKKNDLNYIYATEFLDRNYINLEGEEYIRITSNYRLRYGRMDNLDDFSNKFDFTYEKIFNLSDLKNNVLDNIYKYGRSIGLIPSYKPRKIERTLEGLTNKGIKFKIYCPNRDSSIMCENFLIENGYYWSGTDKDDKTHMIKSVDTITSSTIHIYNDSKIIDGFNGRRIFFDDLYYTYPNDLDKIKNEIYNKPNYAPKKINRTLESVDYSNPEIRILCNNKADAIKCEKFLIKNGYYWGKDTEKVPLLPKIPFDNITISIYKNTKNISGIFDDDIEGAYVYPTDITHIMSELKLIPSYKPRKIEKTTDNMNKIEKTFESFLSNKLILEKSSLTNLGVPREVMQPIQRDFAIPVDAEWNRIRLKSDVEKIFRGGKKELVLQISTDSIKVFVSFPTSSEIKYFIDSYILEHTGWSGEYVKLEREIVTLTQLMIQVEPKTLIYQLDSNFSIIRQPKRKLIKKEKSFDEFTTNFKKDFLKNFDSILKRIVGSKYNDAKQEIRDKAKQIEMENNMMLSGLDDPLSGPNSLTILDDFLLQFEDAYSVYFGERLDIQELSEYFSREKIMTSFMYFIYVGRIMN